MPAAEPAEEEEASGAAADRLERSDDSSSSKRDRPREERMPGSVFIRARRHLGVKVGDTLDCTAYASLQQHLSHCTA